MGKSGKFFLQRLVRLNKKVVLRLEVTLLFFWSSLWQTFMFGVFKLEELILVV